jgi:Transposase, Mutator family
VCEAGRIVSVAVIIAVAVNTDGRREVLGARGRPLGGGAVLDEVPALANAVGLEGRQARHLGSSPVR